MSLPADIQYVINEFRQTVNMPDAELDQWLQREESRSAPDHDQGQRVLTLLRTSERDYTDGDLAAMRDVIDNVRERLTLDTQPSRQDVATSIWRYRLMNWGHDPLKDQRH